MVTKGNGSSTIIQYFNKPEEFYDICSEYFSVSHKLPTWLTLWLDTSLAVVMVILYSIVAYEIGDLSTEKEVNLPLWLSEIFT